MKILCIGKSTPERQLVLDSLNCDGHDVHVVKGSLTGISSLGTGGFDFTLIIESSKDVYPPKAIIDFAKRHHVPFLLIRGRGKELLGELDEAIGINVYNDGERLVTTKSPASLTGICGMVEASKRHWERIWGPAHAC